MYESNIRIQAFKPRKDRMDYIEVCDVDDTDATIFNIHYPASPYNMPLTVAQTAYQAKCIVSAMEDCFKAGMAARSKEIMELLKS